MRNLLLIIPLALPLLGHEPDAREWAEYWADAYGMPRELVSAVIEAESGWNPGAVSSAGAVGLMQLMPSTAVAFRVRNRFDPAENIRGGLAYLAWLREQFAGDWRMILASYVAGPGRVVRRGLNYDAPEVHRYVEHVAFLYQRNRLQMMVELKSGGPK